jgi:hypothetical protein
MKTITFDDITEKFSTNDGTWRRAMELYKWLDDNKEFISTEDFDIAKIATRKYLEDAREIFFEKNEITVD